MQITTVILIILVIWLGALTFFVYSFTIFFRKLTKDAKGESLKEVLASILEVQNNNRGKIDTLEKELLAVKEDGSYHVQKIGVVRFNPFEDTGGDHSFSLAILDGKDSGVVITGLHTRERTRIYMKMIKEGKSGYDLSEEEKKALVKAKKS